MEFRPQSFIINPAIFPARRVKASLVEKKRSVCCEFVSFPLTETILTVRVCLDSPD